MNINYYTLCWGDYYLKSLLDISLKSFFSKKPKNFNKFNHNVFLYTDNKKSKLKKKTKKFLSKKNINIHFVDFSKEINLVKNNKISVWKNLGKFQLHSIAHSHKYDAKAVFLFPDEIHSAELFSIILKNINKNLILIPSNEINKKKINNKLTKILKKNEGIIPKKKMYSLISKSSLNLISYAFVDQNYYNYHNSRYYFHHKDILHFKNIHLSTIFLNPKIFFKRNSFFQNFYTLDMTLSNKDLNKKIVYPDEALLFSLEENEETTVKKTFIKNKFLLFLFRIMLQIRFSFNNKDGIDPINYLRTFKIKTKFSNRKSNFLTKYIFFDFFSYLNFFLSFLIFIFYYIFKKAYYFPKKTKKISERLYKKNKWIKSK